MSLLVKLAVFALCAYAAILLAAYLGQRRLMYFPDRAYTRPAEVGLMDVEERVLKTPDGARVITWYGKAQPGKPTLLYFHGNAGSLAVRAERIRRFMNEGWGVCMMSYRGYSGSKGSPTETANVADARLAYGALVQDGRGSRVDHTLRRVAGVRRRGAAGHGAADRRAHSRRTLYVDPRGGRAGLSLPAGAPLPQGPLRVRGATSARCGRRC